MEEHDNAAAFAALQAIEGGQWDRFLLRLNAAVQRRRRSPGYQEYERSRKIRRARKET